MKRLLGSMGTATLLLAACGGNVLVDGPSATGGAGGAPTGPTTGAGAVTTTYPTTTYPTTTYPPTTTTTVASSSSGGPCVMTCNEAINQNGLTPCGGNALAYYDALLSCACSTSGPCATSCSYNFCLHQAVPPPCAMCLVANCGANYMNCVAN